MQTLILAMAALVETVACAWELDLSKEQPQMHWWSENKALDRCRLEYAPNPATGKQALKASWDAGITDYMHILHNPKGTLPDFKRAQFVATITTAMPLPVSRCRLRMQDKNTETFYWPLDVNWLTPGRHRLEWIVDTSRMEKVSYVSHGTDANRRLDFPIKSVGLTLDFPEDGMQGEAYVESLTMESLPQEPVAADKDYPMTPLARPFIDPLKMPQRLPFRDTVLEEAVNPVTEAESLKMTANGKSGCFGVNFTIVTSPRGVLGQKLGRQHGGEMTVRVTTEHALPEVTTLRLTFVEAVGGPYIHRIPVNFDKAGAHRIAFVLPKLVRTKKPWGSRDWQETPLFVLAGVGFECKSDFQGSVYLDGIDAKWSRSPLEALHLQLKTGAVGHVVTQDKAAEGVAATLCNMASEPAAFKVTGKLTDCYDAVQNWTFARDLTLGGGATIDLCTVPVPPRFGVYYVEFEVAAPGMAPQSYRRSFAHMKLTGAKPGETFVKGFKFGSVCHLDHAHGSPETVREAAAAMSQIGLRILRTDVRWDASPLYLKHLDGVVETFSNAGMNFDFILPGLRAGNAKYNMDACLDGYRKLFERYKGRIQYWEMLNEPDIPWGPVEEAPKAPEYIALAKETAKLLRETDPAAQLMSAGYCTLAPGARGMGPFHYDSMAALKDVFDIHCFHGHGPFERYAKSSIQNGLLQMRESLGIDIPWYANETALTSRGGVTEKMQAEAVYKKLLFSWSRGARGFTWYNLRSKGELPDDGEHNYGMMTWDFYPKAVYAAYNGLTGLYNDKEFMKACDLPWGEWALAFKSDRDIALCVWNDGQTSIQRQFKTDAAAAELADMFGNRTPAPVIAGTVLVETGCEPKTLVLKDASSIDLLPPLVRFQMPELLLPGQAAPLTVSLVNPFGEARKAMATLTLPETVACNRNVFEAVVPPFGLATFDATLTLSAGVSKHLAAREWVLVEGRLEGLTPVRQMNLLPAPFRFESRMEGKPLFDLADHTKVTQLCVGDPAKEDNTWKGPEDLSAKVWLAMDDQALTVKVVATDDRHCQKHAATGHPWDGDSVQLFLAPAGMETACEMDFARDEDGRNHARLRQLPLGVTGDETKLKLSTARDGDRTTYVITIPFAAIGSDAAAFARGFKFNLMVNDTDNDVREGWVQVAPGIGSGTVNMRIMPTLLAR